MAASIQVIEKDYGYDGFIKAFKGMKGLYSDIGFFEGFTYPDGDDIAYIASINEYGCEKVNIPERPFMRNTIDNNDKLIVDFALTQVELVAKNAMNSMEAMKEIGFFVVELMQNTIIKFDSPPNSAFTIAKKGFDDPLVETRLMLNSIRQKEGKK